MNQKNAKRRSIRLADYDYSRPGAYFTTVCTKNGKCLFGKISHGRMLLNKAGEMVESSWKAIPDRFSFAELDEFVVMPNHLHGIVILNETGDLSEIGDIHGRGEPCVRPNENGNHPNDHPSGTKNRSLGRIIQAFKSISTRAYIKGVQEHKWTTFNSKLWQRGYYEHVVRNAGELNRIREYIVNNPAHWLFDHENPEVASQSEVRH